MSTEEGDIRSDIVWSRLEHRTIQCNSTHSIHIVIGSDAFPQAREKSPRCATTDQEGVVYRLHFVISLVPFVLSAIIPCSNCCSRSVRTRMMYGICYMIHDTWHCVHTHMVYDVMRALIWFMVYGIKCCVCTLIWYMVSKCRFLVCCSHYIYVHMYLCMYVRLYVCMFVCMYVFTSVCMHICVYVCMHVRMFLCICKPRQGESAWCAMIDQEGVVYICCLFYHHIPVQGDSSLVSHPCVSFSSLFLLNDIYILYIIIYRSAPALSETWCFRRRLDCQCCPTHACY